MCTYKNIHQHTYCTNLAVQANEQSVAAQADEQSVRTAVNRWRKDRVKLTADSEKRTQNLIMIMVLKKNTKKKQVDGRLWKKNTKLDYDYGLKKKLTADFEKRTQNLIMIMVLKK